jgi:nucleotide-binding universal stress UspA family protein
MFHSILVAVDDSPDADQALVQAIDLAHSEGARLTILTAVAPPAPYAYFGISGEAVTAIARDAEAEAQDILVRARNRVAGDVSVTSLLSHDPISVAIIRQISDGHHDLVVMGSRGRGAVRSAVLGSASHYVLNHSPIPVLIAHASPVHAEPADAAVAPERSPMAVS